VTVVPCIGIIWISGITEKALLFSLENKISRIKDEFGLFSKDLVVVHILMPLQDWSLSCCFGFLCF